MVDLNGNVRSELWNLLLKLPARELQSAGLAAFYLTATSSDDSNQCVPATSFIRTALARYGMKSEIVPATLEVSWSRVLRGSARPSLKVGGTTNGHFVIVTENDEFIDPTALQFDDLARRRGPSGFMPMVGHSPDLWSLTTASGDKDGSSVAEAAFLLNGSSDWARYELYQPEVAREVTDGFMQQNASRNLLGWQESGADLFAWLVGNVILGDARREDLEEIEESIFHGVVMNWIGKPQPLW